MNLGFGKGEGTHTKLRLNLAGMLTRLESVGTMSSLHRMVHLKPKITLAQKWHPRSSPFRPFCPVKVQRLPRQIQTQFCATWVRNLSSFLHCEKKA